MNSVEINKKEYAAPIVKVVEFCTECGFLGSVTAPEHEGFLYEHFGNEGYFGEAGGCESFRPETGDNEGYRE